MVKGQGCAEVNEPLCGSSDAICVAPQEENEPVTSPAFQKVRPFRQVREQCAVLAPQ